jgi:uncharacterized protein
VNQTLRELESTRSSIRISPELDVPVTSRIKRIVDTPEFRRLSRISQLGLVSFVYPGATHTRFEHSLGVYRNALLFLQQLRFDPVFASACDEKQMAAFLLAALLHDIGHWPFCHAIEDIRLPNIPRHEVLAKIFLESGEIAECIRSDWGLDPKAVLGLLVKSDSVADDSVGATICRSLLSGPIDIDKLDYLERDSLHAGVPYGRNFDRNRLIRSLCIDPKSHSLGLTEKGKTAAEMLVFARYIMFSEVYWHHTVRSATAMLQRAIFELSQESSMSEWATQWPQLDESEMISRLKQLAIGKDWEACVQGLFGPRRLLFKRVAQFDCTSHPDWHRKLARRPFVENVEASGRLSEWLSSRLGQAVKPSHVLIDAPPVKLEVQFQIDVKTSSGEFRPLGEISPMVESLATRQFDDIVKRVRIFVHPEIVRSIVQQGLDVCEFGLERL